MRPEIAGSSRGRKVRDPVQPSERPPTEGAEETRFAMQIASNGQSWQAMGFCLSGQHGMPPAASVICMTAAETAGVAAAAAKGDSANPSEISAANSRRM